MVPIASRTPTSSVFSCVPTSGTISTVLHSSPANATASVSPPVHTRQSDGQCSERICQATPPQLTPWHSGIADLALNSNGPWDRSRSTRSPATTDVVDALKRHLPTLTVDRRTAERSAGPSHTRCADRNPAQQEHAQAACAEVMRALKVQRQELGSGIPPRNRQHHGAASRKSKAVHISRDHDAAQINLTSTMPSNGASGRKPWSPIRIPTNSSSPRSASTTRLPRT